MTTLVEWSQGRVNLKFANPHYLQHRHPTPNPLSYTSIVNIYPTVVAWVVRAFRNNSDHLGSHDRILAWSILPVSPELHNVVRVTFFGVGGLIEK